MAEHKHLSVRDSGYAASHYENNLDATGEGVTSIDIVVTTPASGSFNLGVDVTAHATVLLTLTEDVTIDEAGTPMVFYARNRQGDHPDDCECDIEQGGTYSGGTVLLQKVDQRGEAGIHRVLKQSTSYLVTITSKGDDNWASALLWVWEG